MSARCLPRGVKIAAALVLVMGLFLLGVALTPPPVPAQALAPPSAAAAATTLGSGVKGTLASFTALIPNVSIVNLPLVAR